MTWKLSPCFIRPMEELQLMSEAQNRPGGDFDVWGRDPTCRVNPLLRRHLRGGVRELSAFHFIGSRAIGQRMESPFSCRRSRRDPRGRGEKLGIRS